MTINKESLDALMLRVGSKTTKEDLKYLITAATEEEELSFYVAEKMRIYENIIEELAFDSERFRSALNRNVSAFINIMTSGINGEGDVEDRVETCTEKWFKGLIITDEAKQELAHELVKRCSLFRGRSLPTLWISIAMGHEPTMKRVQFTIDDTQ